MNKIKSRDGRNSSVQYSIDKILKTQILKWKNPNRYRNSKITEEVIRRSVRRTIKQRGQITSRQKLEKKVMT